MLTISKAAERIYWAGFCGELTPNQFQESIFYFDFQKNTIKKRTFPIYPIFTYGGASYNKLWKAPTSRRASCYKPRTVRKVTGTCTADCFTGNQNLWYASGYIPVQQAAEEHVSRIMTLADNATLAELTFQERQVERYLISPSEDEKTLVQLSTEYGQPLEVTFNHLLVSESGYLQAAGLFKVGDAIITASGEKAVITSINYSQYQGVVYNVVPRAVDESGKLVRNGQLIVAQGYLSGTGFIGQEGIQYLRQYNLRQSTPHSLDM
jgi:hypothetical protein